MTEIPVYLFTGFLDAGKTKFIQETLEDKRFNAGEHTLLLLCEEGEEEYDPSLFSGKNVAVYTVESPEELTEQRLAQALRESKASRVIVEYNGMWLLDHLYNAMPKNWVICQEMMFADANTVLSYNANMRQLVVDKLTSCELVVFNRAKPGFDKMALHKLVRGVTRRADIAYEYVNGSVEPDDIEDPLPFDLSADVIVIEDRDYAIFYRDLMEEMPKYQGKTIQFKGIIAFNKKLPDDNFVAGRHVMTCCADDITYHGMVCRSQKTKGLATGDWLTLTGKLTVEYHKLYGQKGPVLKVMSLEKTDPPADPVATFY